jgi:Uma2 family endonuclease
MAMPSTRTDWTVDMLDALPDDGNRYEIDGELFVTPAPSDVHQLVVGAVYTRLRAYLDVQTKRELYLRNGVPEYWVIDIDARTVTRCLKALDPGEVLSHAIEWELAGMYAPLTIELSEFFADALG